MEKKQLTVAELIELLQQEPPDYLVVLEGCDCYGNAGGVTRNGTFEIVEINRT